MASKTPTRKKDSKNQVQLMQEGGSVLHKEKDVKKYRQIRRNIRIQTQVSFRMEILLNWES